MPPYVFISLALVFSPVGFIARWLWTHPPCLRCGRFLQTNDAGYCTTCAAVRRIYTSTYTDKH